MHHQKLCLRARLHLIKFWSSLGPKVKYLRVIENIWGKRHNNKLRDCLCGFVDPFLAVSSKSGCQNNETNLWSNWRRNLLVLIHKIFELFNENDICNLFENVLITSHTLKRVFLVQCCVEAKSPELPSPFCFASCVWSLVNDIKYLHIKSD